MRSDPTAVVSKEIFSKNSFPYLELRRPFILGLAERKWKATVSHWFVRYVPLSFYSRLVGTYMMSVFTYVQYM